MTSYYVFDDEQEVNLEDMFLRSPYGITGAEYLLPDLLPELLKEIRRKDWICHRRKRRRRLSEEQIVRAWSEYRRELVELQVRLQKNQQTNDELLLWLALFWLQHYLELVQITVIFETKWALQAKDELGEWKRRGFEDSANILRQFHGEDWESVYGYYLGCEREWQDWAANWLLDALSDEELLCEGSPAFTTASSQQVSGGSDDDGKVAEPQPCYDNTPDIEF